MGTIIPFFHLFGIFFNNEYSKYDVKLLHVYRTAHIKPNRWRSYSISCMRSSGNHTFLPNNNCCPLTPVMKYILKRDHTLQWHLYHILVDHMPSAYDVDVLKTRLFVWTKKHTQKTTFFQPLNDTRTKPRFQNPYCKSIAHLKTYSRRWFISFVGIVRGISFLFLWLKWYFTKYLTLRKPFNKTTWHPI